MRCIQIMLTTERHTSEPAVCAGQATDATIQKGVLYRAKPITNRCVYMCVKVGEIRWQQRQQTEGEPELSPWQYEESTPLPGCIIGQGVGRLLMMLLFVSICSNNAATTTRTTATKHLQELCESTAFPFYDGRILIETVFAIYEAHNFKWH